jgi:hypothetical protein
VSEHLKLPEGVCECGCGERIARGSRFARGHNRRAIAPEDRFWTRVDRKGDDDCWPWVGARNQKGYGVFEIQGRRTVVHRFSYELVNGPIPSKLVIDHLCRNTSCVNPAHLEAVTNRENILRGIGPSARAARATHCPKGHPYSGANLYVAARGDRQCRTCIQKRHEREAEHRKALQAAIDKAAPDGGKHD